MKKCNPDCKICGGTGVIDFGTSVVAGEYQEQGEWPCECTLEDNEPEVDYEAI